MSWLAEEAWEADEETEKLNKILFGNDSNLPLKNVTKTSEKRKKEKLKKKTQKHAGSKNDKGDAVSPVPMTPKGKKIKLKVTAAGKKQNGEKTASENVRGTDTTTTEVQKAKRKRVKKKKKDKKENPGISVEKKSEDIVKNATEDTTDKVAKKSGKKRNGRRQKKQKKAPNKYSQLAGLTKDERAFVLAGGVIEKPVKEVNQNGKDANIPDDAQISHNDDDINESHKPKGGKKKTQEGQQKAVDQQIEEELAQETVDCSGRQTVSNENKPKKGKKRKCITQNTEADVAKVLKVDEVPTLVKSPQMDSASPSKELTKKTKKKRKTEDVSDSGKKPRLENNKNAHAFEPSDVKNGAALVTDGAKASKKVRVQNTFDIGKLKRVLPAAQPSDAKDGSGAAEDDSKKEPSKAEDKRKWKDKSLKERMTERLQQARFRHLNETLYTTTGAEAFRMFTEDEMAFHAYHEGYQSQVAKWPQNPVKRMVSYIKRRSKELIVADFGCGDAKIAQSVPNKVHSFDLVANNEHVTACDMSKVPLKTASVDIAVFCLSLMGTNLVDYLLEANRVLKKGGALLVAEVVSRFEKVGAFIRKLEKMGFSLQMRDDKNEMFVWFEFHKTSEPPSLDRCPKIELMPCVYKKR